MHCGCSPPFGACVLCTGRTNNVDTPPDPCSQTTRERYAILDPALHHVLSDSNGTALLEKCVAYSHHFSNDLRATVRGAFEATLVKSKVSSSETVPLFCLALSAQLAYAILTLTDRLPRRERSLSRVLWNLGL
jgi:hypothetical protein